MVMMQTLLVATRTSLLVTFPALRSDEVQQFGASIGMTTLNIPLTIIGKRLVFRNVDILQLRSEN